MNTENQRQPLIAGNWKMHGTRISVDALLAGLKEGITQDTIAEWVVLPPAIYLPQVAEQLEGTAMHWGGQNVSDQVEGAHTGEISAVMLREFGCHYVLVGHSERRHIYGENNAFVARKCATALAAGLMPILCVGETLEQRESDQTEAVIVSQLQAVIDQLDTALLAKIVVAYEPVWAIGTGHSATPEQAQAVHQQIRAHIARLDSVIAENLRILYGGSVKPENAGPLLAMPDIDGGLIGGASLKAQDFLQIGALCNSY